MELGTPRGFGVAVGVGLGDGDGVAEGVLVGLTVLAAVGVGGTKDTGLRIGLGAMAVLGEGLGAVGTTISASIAAVPSGSGVEPGRRVYAEAGELVLGNELAVEAEILVSDRYV